MNIASPTIISRTQNAWNNMESDFLNIKKRLNKKKRTLARFINDHRHHMLFRSQLKDRQVFFESYDGSSQTCHPSSIFLSMINDERFDDYSFVWSYSGESPSGLIWETYQKNKKVTWAKYKSHKYFKYIATSRFIVNNSTFPAEVAKKKQQIYLNTWHGIPLKRMGYDIPLGIGSTRNVVRNLLSADFIVSPNRFMTENIWHGAFKLQNIYTGRILESGSPRTDCQVVGRERTKATLLEHLGFLDLDLRKKVVLYAPTWSGTSPSDVVDARESINRDVKRLRELLPSNDYEIFLKTHQLLNRKYSNITSASVRIIDNDVNTNMLLTAVDHLVTDQSSIVFDFLLEDKPIHFYVDVKSDQDTSRGTYFKRDQLPGTQSESISEVADHIINAENGTDLHAENRQKWRNEFAPNDDGSATERIIEEVFLKKHNNDSCNSSAIDLETNIPNRILIHVGSLIGNGITTSAINMANALSDLGHDVSILYPHSSDSHRTERTYDFNKNIRHFPRIGSIALPLHRRKAYRRFLSDGGKEADRVNLVEIRKIFENEWRRCFGDSAFDTVIAFDGYSVFWAELLLSSNVKNRLIWMHNDLMADSRRSINGAMPHYNNLTSLFSIYNDFNKIVSVSADLNSINSIKMSKHAPVEKFVPARNLIDQNQVIRLSKEFKDIEFDKRGKNFVTVGRLSPEKNQARMIRALKIVHSEHEDANLYIVGAGPLEAELRTLAAALDLRENVHFLGFQRNPHAIVRKCDCFLFSSKYEGQGLAVIEAMVLGKPVVTTRYNVVNSVVGPNDGIITDETDEDLARGMLQYLNEGLPEPTFNASFHNHLGRKELEAVLNMNFSS